MSKDEEIISYNLQISSKVDCLKKLHNDIYELINPRECGVEVTDYLYNLVCSLDESIEKFMDLINACDGQVGDKAQDENNI